MIDRDLDYLIEEHFRHNSSALLLTGARQTGKTFALRKYAKNHELHLVEVNFLEDPKALSIFEGARHADEVLLRLSAYSNDELIKGKTLIFFDEVQRCTDLITWIKFLVDEGSYSYALSGSLLGVELKDIRSIPVGYLHAIEVFPLDLMEFAKALGVSGKVLDSIHKAWMEMTPVDPVIHESLMKVVALYLTIGGMPAVVQTYLDTNNLRAVQDKQKEILTMYRWDIAQYDPDNKLYIDEIFSLIPAELNAKNKRFILKDLNEHRQFSRHENGFVWLKDAGVALPTYNVEQPTAPMLLSEQHNLFKLFQNDVGLLAAQYADDIALRILSGDVCLNFGAIYENLVAQELTAHGYKTYYFNSKQKGEVDFVIENDGVVTPIEVKSGKDYARHRALDNLLSTIDYHIDKAIVLCNDNVHTKDAICYLPIYMTMYIRKEASRNPLIYKIDLSSLEP